MAEAHKRAHQHPKYKTSYRINNWPEYEKSLRNRGDITVLMDLYLPCPDHTGVLPKNWSIQKYSFLALYTSILLCELPWGQKCLNLLNYGNF